jgi:hypothetical protein
MGALHDFSNDGGRRFYCYYNGTKYYMACHNYYKNDKFDEESTKLIFHSNHIFGGENFTYEDFGNKFRLYYKDDFNGMKSWMLFIHKQQNIDNFTPVFHKNNCSEFIFEKACDDYFYIKDTQYNVYLYLNHHKERDSNKDGKSFYAGATFERDRATLFKYNDI